MVLKGAIPNLEVVRKEDDEGIDEDVEKAM